MRDAQADTALGVITSTIGGALSDIASILHSDSTPANYLVAEAICGYACKPALQGLHRASHSA